MGVDAYTGKGALELPTLLHGGFQSDLVVADHSMVNMQALGEVVKGSANARNGHD